MTRGSSPGKSTSAPVDRGCRAYLSYWKSVENPRRLGPRSVSLRSVTATTSSLGPFHHAWAGLTAAAWDKPRSAGKNEKCPPVPLRELSCWTWILIRYLRADQILAC